MKKHALLSVLVTMMLVTTGCFGGSAPEIPDEERKVETVQTVKPDDSPGASLSDTVTEAGTPVSPPGNDEEQDPYETLLPYVGVWEREDGCLWLSLDSEGIWQTYDFETNEIDSGWIIPEYDYLALTFTNDELWNSILMTEEGSLWDGLYFYDYLEDIDSLPAPEILFDNEPERFEEAGYENEPTPEQLLSPYIGIWASGDALDWLCFYDDGSWLSVDLNKGTFDYGWIDIPDGSLDLYDEDGNLKKAVSLTASGELSDGAALYYLQDMDTLPFFDDEIESPQPDPGAEGGKEEEATDSQTLYKPVYDKPITGNFTDIDKSVFENSDYAPEEVVGRWYEDGWSNGYYLEFYGDGTWQFFGEKTESGYYTIQYSTFSLMQGYYDVAAGQIFIFPDTDGSPMMSFGSFSWAGDFKARSRGANVYFKPASESKICPDLDAFYSDKYPYAWLEGTWYPVGDNAGSHRFILTSEGTWSEVANAAAFEVGRIEPRGEGRYESEGANFGSQRVFEYTGDGYLYIDGEAYERREAVSEEQAPDSVVGTFLYYDMEKDAYSDRGYVFYSDWTFRSLPDTASSERGTFILLGDNLLLYDENGYRIHRFYQNEFMAEVGSIHTEALDDSLYRQD